MEDPSSAPTPVIVTEDADRPDGGLSSSTASASSSPNKSRTAAVIPPPPRAFEYFFVLGVSDDQAEDPLASPRSIFQYPPRNHPDCAAPDSLWTFCLLTDSQHQITGQRRAPIFFVTVLTEMNGQRLFCGCLNYAHISRGNVVPRALCLLSRYPLFDAFRQLLCYLYGTFAFVPSMSNLKNKPSGRLLYEAVVLMMDSVHMSRSPTEKVRLQFGPALPELIMPMANSNLAPVKVLCLFQALDVKHILLIVTAVLANQRVLFRADSYWRLTEATEAVMALLYPFRFLHVYIPVLPPQLLDIIGAPTPFVIGLHSSAGNPSTSPDWPSLSDVLLIDLDENRVDIPEVCADLPPLPEPQASRLVGCLRHLLKPDECESDLAFRPGVSTRITAPDEIDKCIRALFLEFFCSLFGTYRQHLLFVRLNPQPVILFDTHGFLREFRAQQEAQINWATSFDLNLVGNPAENQLLDTARDTRFVEMVLESNAFSDFVERFGRPDRHADVFDRFVNALPPMLQKTAANSQQLLSQAAAKRVQSMMRPTSSVATRRGSGMPELPRPSIDLQQPGLPAAIAAVLNSSLATNTSASALALPAETPRTPTTPAAISQPQQTGRSILATRNSIRATMALLVGSDTKETDAATQFTDVVFEDGHEPDEGCMFGAVLPSLMIDPLVTTETTGVANITSGIVASKATAEPASALRSTKLLVEGLENAKLSHLNDHAAFVVEDNAVADMIRRCLALVFTVNVLERDEAEQRAMQMVPTIRRFFRDEWVRVFFVCELEQYAQQRCLRSRQFEVLLRLVNCVLRDESNNQYSNVTSRRILPLLVNFFQYVNGIEENLCARVGSHVVWEDVSFWLHMFYIQMQESLIHAYDLKTLGDVARVLHHNTGEESLSDEYIEGCNREEDRMCGQLSTILNFIVSLGLDHSVSLGFLEAVHDSCPISQTLYDELLQAKENIQRSCERNLELLAKERSHSEALHDPERILPPKLVHREVLLHCQVNVLCLIDDKFGSSSTTGPAQNAGNNSMFAVRPAEGSLFVTNYRVIFRGYTMHTRSADKTSVSVRLLSEFAIPLRAVFRVRRMNSQGNSELEQIQLDGLEIQAATFQSLRVCIDEGGALSADSLGAFIVKQVFERDQGSLFAYATTNDFDRDAVPASANVLASPSKPHVIASRKALGLRRALRRRSETSQTSSKTFGWNSFSFIESNLERADDTEAALPICSSIIIEMDPDQCAKSYDRFGMVGDEHPFGPWRLTAVNSSFLVCPSYPPCLPVPKVISDSELRTAATEFRQNRFPVLTWQHPVNKSVLLRSASLRREHSATPSTPDVVPRFIQSILLSTPRGQDADNWNVPALYIISNRFHFRRGDATFEAGGWDRERLGLPHIEYLFLEETLAKYPPDPATLAISHSKLFEACCSPVRETDQFMTAVQESHWLNHVSALLDTAVLVADLINVQGSSVLVAIGNGRDRSTQVVALAQVLMDDRFRTFDGFLELVRREWLSFGHAFNTRCTRSRKRALVASPDSDLVGFSPVFVLFLDAVYQLTKQFPMAFEFNHVLLERLFYHTYSGRFGSFLFDNGRERKDNRVSEMTESLFEYLEREHRGSPTLFNFDYSPSEQCLRPFTDVSSLPLWPIYVAEGGEGDFPGEGTSSRLIALMHRYRTLSSLTSENSNISTATSWRLLWDMFSNHRGSNLRLSALNHINESLQLQPLDTGVSPAVLSPGTRQRNLNRRMSMKPLGTMHLQNTTNASFQQHHRFEIYSTLQPTECDLCHQTLWTIVAKSGYRCGDCGFLCHDKCKRSVPANCHTFRNVEQNKSGFIKHSADHFETIPGEAPAPPSSKFFVQTVYEGFLHKTGGRVRNWKKRWFVLNNQFISYYTGADQMKCKGDIYLGEVESVELMDGPMPANSRPSLPADCIGFYFELLTGVRSYCLCAETAVERKRWVAEIQHALKRFRHRDHHTPTGSGPSSEQSTPTVQRAFFSEADKGSSEA